MDNLIKKETKNAKVKKTEIKEVVAATNFELDVMFK